MKILILFVAAFIIACDALPRRQKNDGDTGCQRRCTKQYRPVCGSDGVTYGNRCTFETAQCLSPTLNFIREGRCPDCDTVCSAMFAPVCGSDGNTYSNDCWLNVQKCVSGDAALSVVPCRGKRRAEDDCSFMCIQVYDPVCGSDEQTYGNRCEFLSAKCREPTLKLKGRGECGRVDFYCDGPCFSMYDPQCGSDGQIYSNKCVFMKKQICQDPTLTLGSNC